MAIKLYIETKFNQKEYDFYYSYNFDSAANNTLKSLSLCRNDNMVLSILNERNYIIIYAYFIGGKDNYHRDYYTKIVFLCDSANEKILNEVRSLFYYILKLLKDMNFNPNDVNFQLKCLNVSEDENKHLTKINNKQKTNMNERTKKSKRVYLMMITMVFILIVISTIAIPQLLTKLDKESKNLSDKMSQKNELPKESTDENKINYSKKLNSFVLKKGLLKAGFYLDDHFHSLSKNEIYDILKAIDTGEVPLKENSEYSVIFFEKNITVNEYSYKKNPFFYCRLDFEENDVNEEYRNSLSFIHEKKDIPLYTEKIFGNLEILSSQEGKTYFIFINFE